MSSSCVREYKRVGVSASVSPTFVVVLLERTEMEVTDTSACYVCKASTSVLVGFCIERWSVAEAICVLMTLEMLSLPADFNSLNLRVRMLSHSCVAHYAVLHKRQLFFLCCLRGRRTCLPVPVSQQPSQASRVETLIPAACVVSACAQRFA